MGRPQMFPTLSAILCVSLLLPSLHCNNNLLCYYSPIMYRNKTFDLILSECPPAELCMTGNGRYGNHSALSARGCMAPTDCGQAHPLPLKGTIYTMMYACCDYNYCNAGHRVAVNSVPLMVAMMTVPMLLLEL
ncbi:protein Bouncer isoform X2 [Coregonus clupeaformis]|uniref:UPAR/Ly6 domain-containing protein n=1 Tax=Coregonus suidteri TaxID=861788 RepID=A0AAN8MJI4_9TELE|nr:protein Bouncer isoform X2 [Coregonus clupeaformis]